VSWFAKWRAGRAPDLNKITVPELKAKGYLVTVVRGVGRCIVVPGAEFDPDWEVCLGDLGYTCVNSELDGYPVTFVVLQSEPEAKLVEAETEAVVNFASIFEVPSNEEVKKVVNVKVPYSAEEDAYVVQLFNEGKTGDEIAELVHAKFPARNSAGILKRIQTLQKTGYEYGYHVHCPRCGEIVVAYLFWWRRD
jgi:hypothetical protein